MTSALFRTALSLSILCLSSYSMAKPSLVYIATQNPEKMGITVAEFDSDTGKLSTPRLVTETRDPAHFTLSADGKRLYMCNTGTPGGVSAFAVEDKKTGALKLLNYKESKGRGPSYISVDKTGHYVLDANYGGGFIEIHSLAADGSLDQQTAFVQHEGSSVHARQNKPYAHWIRTDPTNKFALVADLGTDKIVVYKFDEKTGKLTANEPPFAKLNGGSGPRHLAFHPNGKWLYAVQELSNEVVAFKWDGRKGELTQFQQVKTLPADFTEPAPPPRLSFATMENSCTSPIAATTASRCIPSTPTAASSPCVNACPHAARYRAISPSTFLTSGSS